MAFKYLDYNAFEKRHISPLEIGKRLRIGEKSVRDRIRKMEVEGFIKYYEAIPNFSLFGFNNIGMFNLEAEDIPSKQFAVSIAMKTPQVVDVYDMVGPAFSVTIAGSSVENNQARAGELNREANLRREPFEISDRRTEDPHFAPKRLDWEIINKLRHEAMQPSRTIAADLSVTPRIVEYRIERLLESRVFYIRAAIDARKQRGLIFYGLLLFVDKSRQTNILELISRHHKEKVWSVFTPVSGVIIVNLFALSIGEPEETVSEVLEIPGINRCLLSIFKEIVEPEVPSWIDKAIEEKILGSRQG